MSAAVIAGDPGSAAAFGGMRDFSVRVKLGRGRGFARVALR